MFADELLPATMRADAARPEDGVALDIRLNWYRSLPLSCVEGMALTVDGVPVPQEQLSLRMAGFDGPVEDLGAQTDTWWPVLEDGELVAAGLTPSPGPHDVELAITLRVPYYGPLPDGRFVTITDRARRTVQL